MEIIVKKKHLARPDFYPAIREEIRLGLNHSTTNTPTTYGNATFKSTYQKQNVFHQPYYYQYCHYSNKYHTNVLIA